MSEQERQEKTQDTDEVYPLVALKNIVVFPHNRHALNIAREKTVRAVEEAMMRPDRTVIAATQRDADIDDPESKDIYPTAALAEVTTMHRQQDGSLQVLVRGISRVKIEEYVDAEPFIRVKVSLPPEQQVKGPQADALVRHATNLFERYAQLNRRFSVEDINSIVALKTAARLSDTLAAHLVTQMDQQQDLRETFDPLERLEKICVIMGNEIEILELETTIRSRVRSQVDRTQKEFYLREQLRAIQEELGMETSTEAEELRSKLREKTFPADVAAKARKEIDRLERTPVQSAELAVIRSYIDWLLALPWSESSKDVFDIEATRHILDEDHYGLEGIKERIIEFRQPGWPDQERKSGPDTLLHRTSRRRQNFPGLFYSALAWTQVRPYLAGWCTRRGRDSRTSPHIRRRTAGTHHSKHEDGRCAQPGLPARRDRQTLLGVSR